MLDLDYISKNKIAFNCKSYLECEKLFSILDKQSVYWANGENLNYALGRLILNEFSCFYLVRAFVNKDSDFKLQYIHKPYARDYKIIDFSIFRIKHIAKTHLNIINDN